jgi:hypothetical protein
MNLDFGAVTGISDGAVELILALLPFLIPIVLLELGLMIAALVSIFRHTTYKNGNRILWVLVVVLVNIIGPILYFVIGRGDE